MKKYLLFLLPVALVLAVAFTTKSTTTITGKITDDSGKPVAFATVRIKNTKTATSSSAEGVYSIKVDVADKVLVFSSVGFVSIEQKINNRKVINVTLKSSSKSLQEVVVTSYGVQQRQDMTGSAVTISSQYLSGKVAGVQINSFNGTSPSWARDEDEGNTEGYSNIVENGFRKVQDEPVSTFSIDVDAASYSNVRRFINQGQLPPAGAVRTEEFINYFKYQYPQPTGNDAFSINTEISNCLWNKDSKLVLIGLQGKNIATENLPASNLVFLIDVSGSMQGENRLGLVKQSLKMLTDQLREKDKISIVVYAGSAGLVLPATSGADKIKIKAAIDALEAGGSTAGGAGIQLAYKTAKENLIKEGNNRVILCTDGDFNVGASSDDDMVRLIEKERNNLVYLTVLGYGMGNYKDNKMQQLADKGNGNHAYIDNLSEAKKVLVSEFSGTLFTIAKDVKLQIEFNPAKVAGYRLIGYENRLLNKEDFNDDKKDAGELGSGHTVTALYEIIPAGVNSLFLKNVDPLKYQKPLKKSSKSDYKDELLTIKFRYKAPDKESSNLIVHAVEDKGIAFSGTSNNFRFATAVANYAMLLRNSEFKGNSSFTTVLSIATAALGSDGEGYRKEFLQLVKATQVLAESKAVK